MTTIRCPRLLCSFTRTYTLKAVAQARLRKHLAVAHGMPPKRIAAALDDDGLRLTPDTEGKRRDGG